MFTEISSEQNMSVLNDNITPMTPETPASFHPLSLGQQALWFLYQMAPESVAYNIFDTAVIRSSIDVTALQRAWQKIVNRHPILRTTYTIYEGKPFQLIQEQLEVSIQITDASNWSEDYLKKQILLETDRPFNLEKEPSWRLNLFACSAQKHILLLTMYHIAGDLWSLGLLLNELQVWYVAETKQISYQQIEDSVAKNPPYTEFIDWQLKMLSGPKGEKLWEYWQKQLSGELPILNLPTDRHRPPVQTYGGEIHILQLDKQLIHSLRSVVSSTGTSLYKLMLAAFFVLLYRYTNQEDILVGSPMASRWGQEEFKRIVGYLVNPVVLRATVTENLTFKDFLVQVNSQVKEAQKYQDYPFPLLVEKLQPQRDPSRSPLFQVSFTWQKQRWGESLKNSSRFEESGLEMEPYLLGHQRGASFDLNVMIMERGEVFQAGWQYNTDLFNADTIARMAGHYQTLLEAIAANFIQQISELSLLTETERHQLLVEWNNTEAEYPQDKCIHQLFEEQVERSPDAVAVVFEGEQLTYRELNAKANQLAHYLQSLGVEPDVLVGICVERSLEMVVGLLGILKAGGAYVPLDPAYPKERLAYMLADSQVSVLLSELHLVAELPEHQVRVICLDTDWETLAHASEQNLPVQATATNRAYVIYTSGSTGKPKGVQISHRAAVNLLTSMSQTPGLSERDILLSVTTINFDIAALEIFLPLSVGARVVVVSGEVASIGEQLLQTLQDCGATVMQATPATWQVLLLAGWTGSPQLKILCGGEALPKNLASQLLCRSQEVWNVYGPTETTIWSAAYKVKAFEGELHTSVPIGRPIANTQFYLLDAHLQPVPIGVAGELYIASVGLARGYLNRPDLTAEKFIPNPFSNEPGLSLYKTGDKARYLPDGNIEYLGRIDNQVKIRGFRIELGEIEAVLSQHPGVRETAVITRENVAGDKQLVAYIVPLQEPAPAISDLRRFLKQQLPEYMVPSAFVVLEALPLTPNGKVDRRALPAPDLRKELEESFVAPRTPIEEMLASIWANILLIDSIGVHDNFFTLGGHSLLATQVISRVRDTILLELPLRSLFEAPTIAELASRVEIALKNGQSVEALPLLPIPKSESIPLSFAQTRLWFLDQLQPNSAFYNIPLAWHLSGKLNIVALESSINEIIRRHEALRTNFAIVGDQPVQVIASTLSFQLPVVNLLHLSESEREIEAKRLATVEANRPFNLEQEPLLRGMVLQLGETEYLLLLTMHHIISDGWSLGVFVRELTELYQAFCTGKLPVLPELPVQYADFALWQRQWLTGEILETQLDYWKEQLKNAPNLLELPTDRARPAVQTFRGGYYYAAFSKELSAELATLGKRSGVTLFMTLFAAFQTLLYRYSGQDDIVVGTPVAGRNRRELEGLIGFFVNTLVLRTNLGGNPSFEQLLNRVREVALQGYTHQDLPFEQLVEALEPTRNLSYTPLFQVMFALDDGGVPSMELLDSAVSSYSVESVTAKFDLTLSMENTADGLVAEWQYNSDLFDETTIVRMAEHFQTLLEGIVANSKQAISELPLVTLRERQQLLVEWNNTAKDYLQEKCTHQLFEEQVERTPDAVAVVFEEKQLTYRELNVKANQLANYLRSLGVGPEVLVGICVERSLEMIIGLLGILKAGGAYVPLDPNYPSERLAFMLEDSSVPVLLTQERLVEKLPALSARVICLDSDSKEIASYPKENPLSSVKPENLAYVIYTSGSTGKPKGVLIQHGSLANYTTAASAEYRIQKCDRILQFSSISFDVSAEEIYTSLTSGATLVLRTDTMLDSFEGFLQKCQNWEITVMALPTAYWHELTAFLSPKTLALSPSLRLIILGGEKALPERLKTWFECVGQQVRLFNNYGPTEATIGATIYELSADDTTLRQLPIGRPLGNLCTYILDQNGQAVPIGVPGELHIGGAGLARGYLNRPELTTERFIRNPFNDSPTERLYKTGDQVRYLPDGNIEYLGRIDDQVKVRGFRIELGEIEAALSHHPNLLSVAVVLREDIPSQKSLVAYVVPLQEPAPTVGDLRHFLKERLPDYMVPSAFVILESLPLTPNGKVNRKLLPAPDLNSLIEKAEFVAPQTPTEKLVASIWAEVLGVEQLSIHDNFFELGGHSLLATQLLSKLSSHLGLNLPLSKLFEAPTVASFSSYIEAISWVNQNVNTSTNNLEEVEF
ncbi:amino acid adenylation domain-containing protein [Microcoleus sp. T3_B1]|uniref:amino acid adenylation domain-containing protein n=1 Tax=Microcoleus sp. T3_B1 TaxID=3055425 RepID=UPI002FCF0CBE